MEFPKDLSYTKDHEWARVEGDTVTIGITAFAVDQLGDITMVDLPGVGDELKAGDAFGVVESVKSVSDLYAPISGKVLEINGQLEDAPELVNDEPYGGGWLIKVKRSGDDGELLDAAAYSALVAAE
ncbi:MAG: glycine cleavage system protein GcvH [Myxococcales bacterium]|nr:glycine cleavage system protein GcvH [Myxococcales bacterium]